MAAVPTWAEALRGMRELGAQMTAAVQTMAVAGAKATPPALAQPLARYADQLLTISVAMTTPLRRLIDEQEQLVEKMADWAEQHRHLSEQIATWADQQRRLSEQMVELAQPFLDQAAMLETLRAEWGGRSPVDSPSTSGAATAGEQAPSKPAKTSASKKASPRRR